MRLSNLMVATLVLALFGCVAFIPTNSTNTLNNLSINPDSLQTEELVVAPIENLETKESKEAARRQAFVDALLTTAKSLEGIRYNYAGKTPKTGFDCSGFVSYVFKQHGVNVPVSSRSYDVIGETIPLEEAQPGDIVCFTGTDPSMKRTGHVGIVVENLPDQPVKFIHASSGKAYSVTYSDIATGRHYSKRFRSVRRVSIPDTF